MEKAKAFQISGEVPGREHWTKKGDVNLFLWQKTTVPAGKEKGTILFVHGSSMAAQPTFDLVVPGRADSSPMDYFAKLGYDVWAADMEGYGRSDKNRDMKAFIADGADDLKAVSDYIMKTTGAKKFYMYGISSGALRAALFCQRHPERVARLALDAFVWTGEGSPTLAERKKRLPEFQSKNRRAIDQAFVFSVFNRDHKGCAEDNVIKAFADYILALDDSMPTGTYIDMCANLPVIDPTKIPVPTVVMRGEFDGIAGMEDLLKFYAKLPNPDKQFSEMPGISHASFQQKNYKIVYHILKSFFEQPAPVFTGHDH
jgi:pimeloyl-ACP methyl ester carboxylesterase